MSLATFQGLNSHMWLVTAVLDGAGHMTLPSQPKVLLNSRTDESLPAEGGQAVFSDDFQSCCDWKKRSDHKRVECHLDGDRLHKDNEFGMNECSRGETRLTIFTELTRQLKQPGNSVGK